MINIGFDEDVDLYQLDEDGNPIEKEGDKLSEDLERKLTVFIPERRIQQMKEEFDCVVVHDFGDEYHLSEEERIAKNKFYEAFKVFSKCKHKYRKLDEYVSAMREALKCLDFVAENNGVYNPEKFKILFLKGKIEITGLQFPQFKGKERKSIDWDYLTDFILSDAPPSEVLPSKNDEIRTPEELDELAKRLFDEGELEEILRPETDEEKLAKEALFDVDEDDQDGTNVVVCLTEKQTKKLFKNQPEFYAKVKEMKKDYRRLDNMNRLIHNFTYDDMDEIERYDRIHNYKSSAKMPKFKGNLMKDSDYHRYMRELEDFERENIRVNYHGKLKTLEQIEEIELKQALERNNWNIRNLYGNKEKEAKMRKIQKKDKKREKRLREKLVAVQERKKRRINDDDDYIVSKKSKKKKKGKKKNKNKKKEKLPKESKELKNYKKEAMENFDELLLGTVGRMTGDFKDYKEEALDWSWDEIMKRGK